MTQLIDKSALVVEIENHINRCNIKKQSCPVNTQVEAICDNKIYAYKELLSFLNTLEVKEVGEKSVSEDLEEAADSYIKTHGEILGFGKQTFKAGAEWGKNRAMVEIQAQSIALAHGCPKESITEDLGDYINELSKRYPEISFAKLSRIAVRVAKWQKEQIKKAMDLGEPPYLISIEQAYYRTLKLLEE